MVQIRIDDRVRLMSALLSITRWPEAEQARKRHRAHVHARSTTKRAASQSDHPAVHTLQTLMEQGTPLEGIYSYALTLSWPDLTMTNPLPWAPPHWDEQLKDFFAKTNLGALWVEEKDTWARAQEQISKVIEGKDFYGFFKPFVGEVTEQFILMPNISYPSDTEIGVRLEGQIFCIIPPRIAWGDNEPWPFDDDAGHIFRGMLTEYGRLLMVSYLRQNSAAVNGAADKQLPVSDQFRELHPLWADQFTALFVSGIVALFLEQTLGLQEAKAYVLMENRLHGMTILPGVVSVLKRYLDEYNEGRYERFADFLPNFPKHLRVAKSMVSL